MAEDRHFSVVVIGPVLAEQAQQALTARAAAYVTGAYPSIEKTVALMRDHQAEAIIARQGDVTREVMVASPRLKIVVKHGVGVDNIDVDAATELGIPVCITARANFESVSEHALAMMLSLAKALPRHDRRTRQGAWEKQAIGSELLGKTLGLVGVGRTGRRLAELVQPLRMTVLGFDPYLPVDCFPAGVRRVATLSELLAASDLVSVHCPRTSETVNLLGEAELRQMKPDAILVNTARGGIVNEAALARALNENGIRAAGMDVFETEPVPLDLPLLQVEERLLVSPHVAGVTKEAHVRMGADAVEIVLQCLEGRGIDADVWLNRQALGE